MSVIPRIRWTAPRHADDHVPHGCYITHLYQRHPRDTTLLLKIGWHGRFEVGLHLKWPRHVRWHCNPWLRIVSSHADEARVPDP